MSHFVLYVFACQNKSQQEPQLRFLKKVDLDLKGDLDLVIPCLRKSDISMQVHLHPDAVKDYDMNEFRDPCKFLGAHYFRNLLEKNCKQFYKLKF